MNHPRRCAPTSGQLYPGLGGNLPLEWVADLSGIRITADGCVVRASEQENSDLFWGLRGGGGNFGVVTHFEYKLYLVGPEVMAGAIAWRAEDAHDVLEMYRTFTEQAPPGGHMCRCAAHGAAGTVGLPKDIHGKPIIALFVCHSGAVEEGEQQVVPIKAFGSPAGDVLMRRSYVSQQSILDATQPKGRRYYWKSEYLPKLDPERLAKVIEHAEHIVSPHSAIILFPIDGALNRLPADHAPMGNRDAACVLNIMASWERAEDDRANIEWARATWSDMRRFSTGGTYINFLTEEESGERIRAAYGKNYDRLVEVKTKWDPDNLFRMNKNIPPQVF